jgi:hypothetical protein
MTAQRTNVTPGEAAQVLEVVRALWHEVPGLADLILGGLGDRALPAALLCLDGAFTATAEALGVPREELLVDAQQAFLDAMPEGSFWDVQH